MDDFEEDIGIPRCFDNKTDDFWDDFDFAVKLGDEFREKDRLEAAARYFPNKSKPLPVPPGPPPSSPNTETLLQLSQTHITTEKDIAESRSNDNDYANSKELSQEMTIASTVKETVPRKNMLTRQQLAASLKLTENEIIESQTGKDIAESTSSDISYTNTTTLCRGMKITNPAEGSDPRKPGLTREELAASLKLTEKDITESQSKESGYSSTWTLSQDISMVNCAATAELEHFTHDAAKKELVASSTMLQILSQKDYDIPDPAFGFSRSLKEDGHFSREDYKTSPYNSHDHNSYSFRSMTQAQGRDEREDETLYKVNWPTNNKSVIQTESSPKAQHMFTNEEYLPVFDSSKAWLLNYAINNQSITPSAWLDNSQTHSATERSPVTSNSAVYNLHTFDRPDCISVSKKNETQCLKNHSDRHSTEMGRMVDTDAEFSRNASDEQNINSHLMSGMSWLSTKREPVAVHDLDPTKVPGSGKGEWLITKPPTYKSSSASLPRISETFSSSSESLLSLSVDTDRTKMGYLLPDLCPTENELLAEIEEHSSRSSIEEMSSGTVSRSLSGSSCLIPVYSPERLSEIISTKNLNDYEIEMQTDLSEIPLNSYKYNSTARKNTYLGNNAKAMESFDEALKSADLSRNLDIKYSQTLKSRIVADVATRFDSTTGPTINRTCTDQLTLKGSDAPRVASAKVSRRVHSRLIEVLPAPDNSSSTIPQNRSRGERFKDRMFGRLRRLKSGVQALFRRVTSRSR